MKRAVLLSCLILIVPYYLFSQNVGIGTAVPVEKLHVAGNIKADTVKPNAIKLIPNAGAGKILTSDAAGNGSWQANNSVSTTGNTGFGVWGDCATNGNISEYNPVAGDDGAQGDGMGNSVSISGNFAIVGAIRDDVGANVDQGSAYIFYYNGTSWVQLQKLIAVDGAANDYFGYKVFISGDYAIVGAPLCNIGINTDQGAAYLFHYNGNSWIQQQKLTAADGLAGDLFGGAVCLSGNYAVVSAFSDDIGANTDQGSAYIFFNNGTNWAQQQKLVADDGVSTSSFGYNISISGNYIVSGAYGTPPYGAAYMFFYNGSSWIQQQKLTGSASSPNDGFGLSVSVSDSYVVVGVGGEDVNANVNQGAAYIFYYNGSNWIEQNRIVASDGAANDFFGNDVSISGNYMLSVAGTDQIGSNAGQGSVYLYQNINGIWKFLQKITDPSGNANDNFGTSCNVNNNRFVIGSTGVSNSRGMIFFGKIN